MSAESSVAVPHTKSADHAEVVRQPYGPIPEFRAYNGGSLDGESEQFWMAGLNLEYRFNPNFSAHVGYSYDRLGSDILWNPADANSRRSQFDRNRVYIGFDWPRY